MDASQEKADRKWPIHRPGASCQGCDARMREGHPVLKQLWESVKKQFPSAHMSWVWRNKAQQLHFMRQDHSKLLWPNSQHNKLCNGEPCSRAFDLFSLNDRGAAMWDPGYMRDVWKWVQHTKLPVRWGGAWTKLGDYNHFELEKWVEPKADGEDS